MKLPVVNVIMAGGSGERFWPISRKNRPKQLLYLTNDSKRMIEEAIDRMLPLASREHIYIATNSLLQKTMQEVLSDHPADKILGEPAKRNTTGCLAFAAAHLLAGYPTGESDLLMAVTTADHLIRDEDRFRDTVTAALRFAESNDALVTIGVHPTRPETGYGYVEITQLNQTVAEFDGIPIYRVARFLEKPDLADAERYQASRFYYWNSGMFFWRLSVFLNSMERVMPDVVDTIHRMADCIRRRDMHAIEPLFVTIPDISIDYALMEKADNVYTALGDFRWDDVGSWDSLSRYRPRDENQNTLHGDPVVVDCRNVTVYNEPGAEQIAVCVVGVENLIVVTSKDGVLVCSKGKSQDVRKGVNVLKERNAWQL